MRTSKQILEGLDSDIEYWQSQGQLRDISFYEDVKEYIKTLDTVINNLNEECETITEKLVHSKNQNMHFNQILHRLNTFYAISMRSDCVSDMLTLIHKWSYAHRQGNGELTEEEQQEYIDKAWYSMINYQVKPLKEVRKSNE